jgi:hypothetical protein
VFDVFDHREHGSEGVLHLPEECSHLPDHAQHDQEHSHQARLSGMKEKCGRTRRRTSRSCWCRPSIFRASSADAGVDKVSTSIGETAYTQREREKARLCEQVESYGRSVRPSCDVQDQSFELVACESSGAGRK